MENSFVVNTTDGKRVEFIQTTEADCLITIDYATMAQIPSEEMVKFICWCLPPALHEILAKHGVELGKVY